MGSIRSEEPCGGFFHGAKAPRRRVPASAQGGRQSPTGAYEIPGVPEKSKILRGKDAANPKHIMTVWGYGYKWEA